jgi:dTDP-4-amino-4,6-dideoxygalactose transaminase
MISRDPLFVTRPTLPPFEEVQPLLEKIWQSRILSNGGPFLQRFEQALAEHLGVAHLSLVANATLGTILALRQAGITSGEVVTTPFSFVATSHAIRWAGAEPVFAEIDPVTLNLDPAAADRAITPDTKAILAVHCFGVPCDTAGLAAVARAHGIPLVYDAAHAFGVRDDAGSLLNKGDISVLSFHATKVFNTLEGGAVILPDRAAKLELDRLVNHGIESEEAIPDLGMNAKMNEICAAIGLVQLPHVGRDIAARGVVARRYWDGLSDVPGIRCLCPPDVPGQNHYAFPILVGPDYPWTRERLIENLKADGILARRYFYPLISDLPHYRELPSAAPDGLPIARRAANEVLCLPMFPDLAEADQARVIEVIRDAVRTP